MQANPPRRVQVGIDFNGIDVMRWYLPEQAVATAGNNLFGPVETPDLGAPWTPICGIGSPAEVRLNRRGANAAAKPSTVVFAFCIPETKLYTHRRCRIMLSTVRH